MGALKRKIKFFQRVSKRKRESLSESSLKHQFESINKLNQGLVSILR